MTEYALHILKRNANQLFYLEIIFHTIQLKDLRLVPITIS